MDRKFDFNDVKSTPETDEILRQKVAELNNEPHNPVSEIEFNEHLEKSSMLHTITENTNQIEEDVSALKAESIKLHDEVTSLKQELADERTRAELAEKKVRLQSQIFSVLIAIFSVVLGNGLPRLISWIQSLLQ